MKTKLILIIVFVSTEWCAHAQLTFQKNYKGIGVNGSQSISHTFDNGFIIAGLTQYFDTIDFDNSLCKLDSLGNVEWNTVIGDSLNEQCYSVQQTYDGGYVAAGHTRSFAASGADAFFFKVDASGNMLWAKIIDGIYENEFLSVKQTSDSGLIFLGWTTGFGAVNDNMFLMKTNSLGNIQWAKTYGGNWHDAGMSVIQTSDGGYLLGGHTGSFWGSGQDGYVIKTDVSGNIQWSKLYTGLDDDAIYDVKELNSHTGYVLIGATNSYPPNSYNIFLIKTDLSGDIVWSNAYGSGAVTYDWGFSLDVNSNNEVLLCGSTNQTGGIYGCLLCIDTNGTVEWSKKYGFGTPTHAEVRAISQTSDHGYVLAGNSGIYSTPGSERMYLIKTDSLGNSGCYQQNLSYAAIPLSITAIDVTSQNSSGGAATAVSPLSLFTVVTDTTLCYTTTAINMPDEKNDALLICTPNPFSETTTIQIHSEEIYSDLVIYNLFGQKIKAIHNTTDKKIKFDRSNLPAGLYFICLVQNNQAVATSKLIISGE